MKIRWRFRMVRRRAEGNP